MLMPYYEYEVELSVLISYNSRKKLLSIVIPLFLKTGWCIVKHSVSLTLKNWWTLFLLI